MQSKENISTAQIKDSSQSLRYDVSIPRTNPKKKRSRCLSTKITSVALGTLAFTSLLWWGSGAFYLGKMQRITAEQKLVRSVHLRLLEAHVAKSDFMLRSLRNPTFHVQGTSEELECHQDAVRQVRQVIDDLQQISMRQGFVKKLSLLVDKYEESFAELCIACRARGFKDWGLIGKFRAAVHALENDLERLGRKSITVEMLQLRRAEKDYLLRHELKYTDEVLSQLARIRKEVGKLDHATSSMFLGHLNDYQTAFQDLLDIDEKIGLRSDVGIYAEIQTAVLSIRSTIAAMVDHSDVDVAAVRRQTTEIVILVLIAGTAVAVVLSALVCRTMTRPLAKLLQAVKRVASGDFKLEGEVFAPDEIGEIAASFEELTNTLSEVANVANEISLGHYSTQMCCRGDNDTLGIALANMTKKLREETEGNRKKTKELEAAIQAQARFRTAFDIAADIIFLIDLQESRFIDMNEAACKSLGYSREELLQMGPTDITSNIIHANSEQTFEEVKKTIEAQGGIDAIETIHCRKDGSSFPVEINARILLSDGRKIIVASVRDITERKQAEQEFKSLNKQLVNTAREAGKAEIATSVLHNVGNVLNSVNVSASLIQEKILGSGASYLTKAVGVMEQHLDDIGNFVTQDDRGKHFPQFLIDVSQQMVSEEEMILDEIKSLIGNVDHIKAVVASQQKHAKSLSGVVGEVLLDELLEDAIYINTASMQRHAVKIIRQFDDIGPVYVDKQMLLQIVVNLISNAKYACIENGNESHHITICLQQTGQNHVSIEVRDNGVGITEENLTRIFNHGFTTRKEGHGFGLHSAALAAKELGGSLTATSIGPGAGATFTLKIPMQQARAGVARL